VSFSGFVCWRPECLKDVIVADAVTPSPAVFLATHSPIELYRREFGDSGASQRCDEEDFLQDFLREDADMLLLPITGASGRGKSHMVRWLQARVPATPGRRIVYIPKYQTNLRGVIEEILRGMDGEAATALRLQLAHAADNIDEGTAPDRLLDALAIRVGVLATAAAAEQKDQMRRYACQGLPTLLREDLFREVWLAEHGVIRRFVGEALRGRDRIDRDAPFAFTVDDLPRSVTAAKKASDRAKVFYGHLIARDDLQRACVDVLNECLAAAITEVVGLKSGDLQRILLELRRLLLVEQRELVILIEDFAILQGVQRELLEAIVEAPTRGGERVLCNIRVAMAVTSGYFASIDTVLTRAKFKGHVYSLDVSHSDGNQVRQEVIDFVARYLNAARLGREALDAAYDVAAPERRTGGAWVPNACSGCAYRAICHEAFAVGGRDWGLYPFNVPALERMLRARSDDQFDPREILGSILNHTLYAHADDLRDGRFPSKTFAEKFVSDRVDAVAGSLEAALALDKKHGARRLPLLVFWGGNPREPVNLKSAIHEAFAIPALSTVVAQNIPRTLEPPADQPPVGVAPIDPQVAALTRDLDKIDRWKDGTYTLEQDLRRELASWVAEAVGEKVEWNDFCCPKLMETDQKFWARSVRFEAAAGEATAIPMVSIRINRSFENARALQALLFYRHHRHWHFSGGSGYFRALSQALDRWATEVRRQYAVPSTDSQAHELVEHLVGYAAFGARVLGEARSRGDKSVDLLSAALERGPDPAKFSYSTARPWLELQSAVIRGPQKADPTREELLKRLLFVVARSQTGGNPWAVDATLLLIPLRQFRRTWRPVRPLPSAPSWLARYFDRIDPRLDPAITDECGRLRRWEQEIRPQFGAASTPKALKEAVVDAVKAIQEADAEAHGQVVRRPGSAEKAARLAELGTALTAVTTGFGVLLDLWQFLARPAPDFGDMLAVLAADRARQEEQLQEFVGLANEFLGQTSAFVEQQRKSHEGSVAGLGPVIEGIQDALDGLVASFRDAKGGQT
jgi:hypothetical protein